MPLLQYARYRDIAAELANVDSEVIVASAGLASAIQWRAAALGGRPVSLKISTLDTFARRLLNDSGEYPRVATEVERHLAMRSAASTVDDPMMSTRGIVTMLERSYRDIRDSGVKPVVRNPILNQVWRAYEQIIAALPAVDPADLLERAAERVGRANVAPQIVAGFYDMTGVQKKLLSALSAAGKVQAIYVPIGEGDAYAFASRFIEGQPAAAVLHFKRPQASAKAYANNAMEIRDVCAAVRELLDRGTAANEIGIVARSLDPDDIRLLQRFSAEHGFNITARNDLSLNAHRIGRGVAAILRGEFTRATVVDILRDGYIARERIGIDHLDIATRQVRVHRDDAALESYRKIVAELEGMSSQPLDRIAAKFLVETELDLAAAQAFDDLAALLGRWKQKVDRETIIELVRDTELLQRHPANGNPVIWAGDVMKFRGRAFEHLFVIRAQESTLPQRRVGDPLLPDAERRRLGVREIGDGREEERLLFQLLLDGASTSVQFSFASSDAFGKSLRPSRMLRNLPTLSPRERVAEGRVRGVNHDRQLALFARAGTRSSFDGYLPGEKMYTLIINELQAISPTDLETFGECPQKFLLRRILGAQDYDDPTRELQMHPRDKGKLDHTVLERFYRSLTAFPPPDARSRLERIIDEVFAEEEERVPAFNRVMRAIERRATKRHLHAFVAADIEDLTSTGLRPKYVEYKFGPKFLRRTGSVDHEAPFILSAHDVTIRVEGSIDRIDEGADTLRIVDYKSGKALRHKDLAERIHSGTRLQLPLYAMAVAEFFDATNVSGAIKPLMPGTKAEKLQFELGETEERIRETLDLFVAAMLGGRFPAFPDDDACKYCPAKHSCRTKHSDAETRALAEYEDPRQLLESQP